MNRLNTTFVAALLAVAAVLGTVAATHTMSLGAAHRSSSGAAVVARTKQLNRFEASLHHALAKRPPALPAVPKMRKAPPVSAVSQAPATAPAPAAPQQRVIYRRPPPIVIVKHRHHDDDGSKLEAEGGGGGD